MEITQDIAFDSFPHGTDNVIHSNNLVLFDSASSNSCFSLAFGTLLGAWRDHMIIENDSDVDVSMLRKEFTERFPCILERWRTLGGRVCRVVKNAAGEPALVTLEKSNQYLDVYVWDLSSGGDKYTCCDGVYTIPFDYLDKLDMMRFVGRTFCIPSHVEEYLTYLYGTWRVRAKNHAIR